MTFRISRWQMTLLAFLVSTCVTPFVYDSLIIVAMRRHAWMALVPGLAVGLVGTGIALALMARFPGASVTEYAPRVLGTAAGRVYLFLFGLVLFAGAPANLRVLTRITRFTELPRTSPLFTAFLFAAVVAIGCHFGPEVFSRIGEVLALFIAAGLLVIFAAPLPAAVPARLLPLSGFDWRAYFAPSVFSSIGSLRGFLCLLVLGGTVGRTDGLHRWVLPAMLLAWALLALGLAEPVMILGSGMAERLRYPLFSVTGTVSFRWMPFQRLTTVTVLVWEMIMYVVLAFYLWSGIHVLSSALGLRRWRTWLIPAAAAAAYLAGVSIPRFLSRAATNTWDFAVVGVGVLVPLFLLLLAGRRRAAEGRGA